MKSKAVTLLAIQLMAVIFVTSAFAQDDYKTPIRSLIEQQQFESALQLINDTRKQTGNKDEWLDMHQGFVLVQLKRYDEGEKHYKKLIKRYKSNPEPYNNLGVIYRLQRKFEKSIDTFNAGIAKFPAYPRLYENLGDTYMQLAQETYMRGIETDIPSTTLEIKSTMSDNFHQVVLDNLAVISSKQLESGETGNADEVNQPGENNSPDAVKSELIQTLQSWVDAWSKKDSHSYFSYYSRDFVPANGADVRAWADQKLKVFDQSESIEISLENINITLITQSFAVTSFSQHYTSNLTTDKVEKQLSLRKYNEGWLITDERVIR